MRPSDRHGAGRRRGPGREPPHVMTDVVVRTQTNAGIATITLDSPANRNALSSRLLEQLTHALDGMVADDAVRVVVITGAGNTFCAGADLKDPPGNTPGERFGFPTILRTVLTCPKPVIARVNGHVRAGGMGLVAACDIAVAPTDAIVRVRRGAHRGDPGDHRRGLPAGDVAARVPPARAHRCRVRRCRGRSAAASSRSPCRSTTSTPRSRATPRTCAALRPGRSPARSC